MSGFNVDQFPLDSHAGSSALGQTTKSQYLEMRLNDTDMMVHGLLGEVAALKSRLVMLEGAARRQPKRPEPRDAADVSWPPIGPSVKWEAALVYRTNGTPDGERIAIVFPDAPKPREWWLVEFTDMSNICYAERTDAIKAMDRSPNAMRVIHAREVLP